MHNTRLNTIIYNTKLYTKKYNLFLEQNQSLNFLEGAWGRP